MRTLGIIGGVGWHSTLQYYKLLNLGVSQYRGKSHSARVVLTSIDFEDLLTWQKDKTNKSLIEGFLAEGHRLRVAGCEAFIVASHTLSWLGEIIESETGIKHISLYESVFKKLNSINAARVGLTGTRFTMQDPLYRTRYESAGFKVITPGQPHLMRTASLVYSELVHGIFKPESKKVFVDCFKELINQDVDAIVLGCTEIGLLVGERSLPRSTASELESVPLIDLIETHVPDCLAWMFSS